MAIADLICEEILADAATWQGASLCGFGVGIASVSLERERTILARDGLTEVAALDAGQANLITIGIGIVRQNAGRGRDRQNASDLHRCKVGTGRWPSIEGQVEIGS